MKQEQELLRCFDAVSRPLTPSPDRKAYAESVRGYGAICFFSAGVSGTPPTIDSAYSLGGFCWSQRTSSVYWVGLDAQLGCALLRWHPHAGLEMLYCKPFPQAFQIVGKQEADLLLVQQGFLNRGDLAAADYCLIHTQQFTAARIVDPMAFFRPLPQWLQTFPKPKGKQVRWSRQLLMPGEYLDGSGRFIARLALGEGECSLLSIWELRKDGVRRASNTLISVTNWLWAPHRPGGVIAATNGAYTEKVGVFAWFPGRREWSSVRLHMDSDLCRIISVDADGVITYQVAFGKKIQTFSVRMQ